MTKLRIRLLGTLQVERDGEPITAFEADVARALLAVLATKRGMLRRDMLATMLAPSNKTDSGALAYLRPVIGRMRRALRDRDAEPPFLTVTRKEIGFADSVWVDVHEFDALQQAVAQHPHRDPAHCPTCIEKLQQAVALYRGTFISELNFNSAGWDAWRRTEQLRYEQQIISTLETLATWQRTQFDWSGLLTTARQTLRVQAWHEAAHRWAMEALWQQGDLAAALQQHKQCVAQLKEALDVAPSAETAQLLARITGGSAQQAQQTHDHPHNLARVRTRFFGRNHELNQLEHLLTDPHYRLVTLLGEGGIGKTRLSQEAGRRLLPSFPDGVWFVPLANIHDIDGIVNAIAQALDFSFAQNGDPLRQLTRFLRSAELLLILDNMEHLVEQADILLDLLDLTERLAILCTSRAALNFGEETVIPLRGIGKDEGRRMKTDINLAVQLFVERAQRANRRFELTNDNVAQVARVGELVAGSPLGLELAATWVRSRSVGQIVMAIEKSADFLTTRRRDVPRRHRSMRAVFRSSWELLESFERDIFAKLTLFRGGFSAAAALAIADAELIDLETLIDQSLVQFDEERYTIHELLRQFAGEQLTERDDTQARFIAYFADYLAQHAAALKGRDPKTAAAQLTREDRNLWQMWVWATEQHHPLIETHAVYLTDYYFYTGRYKEGEAMLRQTVTLIHDASVLQPQRARLLAAMGRFVEAEALVREGVVFGRILRQMGRAAEAVDVFAAAMETDDLHTKAEALRQQAIATLMSRGDHAAALHQLEEALALCRAIDYTLEEAWALTNMGNIYLMLQKAGKAEISHAAALMLFQRSFYSPGIASTLLNLGIAHREAWNLLEAERRLREALQLYKRHDDEHSISVIWRNLGLVLYRQGKLEQANQFLHDAVQLARKRGNAADEGFGLIILGNVAEVAEEFSLAQQYFLQAQQLGGNNKHRAGFIALAQGNVALQLKEYDTAQHHFNTAVKLRRSTNEPHLAIEALAGLAETLWQQDRVTEARQIATEVSTFVSSGKSLFLCEHPLRIYWRLFLVLKDAKWLHETEQQLMGQAAQFGVDSAERNTFLQNIPLHRTILSTVQSLNL